MELKAQLPELPIEGIGARYIYPFFVALIVFEYFRAKELYDLKESLAGFVMGSVATIIKVVVNVFEITLYMLLFAWSAPFREALFGYESLGWAWYVWLICLVADDHNFYWHHRLCHNVRILWGSPPATPLWTHVQSHGEHSQWLVHCVVQAGLLAVDALAGL